MICDCCERKVEKASRRYWTKGDVVCSDCAFIWYEEGLRNKEEIKRRILEIKMEVNK